MGDGDVCQERASRKGAGACYGAPVAEQKNPGAMTTSPQPHGCGLGARPLSRERHQLSGC
jgi:hypothetical protein